MSALSLILLVSAAISVSGAPARRDTTTLSQAEIDAFTPYTYFASAGYCAPDTTMPWNCGVKCDANPDFVPYASGGDGEGAQNYYVGYSPSLQEVIIGHQGTDPSNIISLATDANAVFADLDADLFPGLSTDLQAHSGFLEAHADSAEAVLAAVNNAIAENGATKVVVTGHSLGGAIALLDGVYLSLHLSGVSVEVISYGMPRVGNQEFADYVDANIPVTHINNKMDFVPIIPGRGLGYHHPMGEIHIDSATDAWNACSGQDNEDPLCTTGAVDNIFTGDVDDHGGPYNGIEIHHECD